MFVVKPGPEQRERSTELGQQLRIWRGRKGGRLRQKVQKDDKLPTLPTAPVISDD